MATLAMYAAVVAFAGAGGLTVMSLLGFAHLWRVRPEDEILTAHLPRHERDRLRT